MRVAIIAFAVSALAERTRFLLDSTWKFELLGSNPPPCADPAATLLVAPTEALRLWDRALMVVCALLSPPPHPHLRLNLPRAHPSATAPLT